MEDIIKESLEGMKEYQKWCKPMMLTIAELFENKKIKPEIMYMILKELVKTLEEYQPTLKLASDMAKKINESLKGEPSADLSTKLFEKMYGKGKEATYWVCPDIKLDEDALSAKCCKCGMQVFYDSNIDKPLTKNAEKICMNCTKKINS